MAKLATLIDDFQDGVIDAAKWFTSGTVAETGGRARLTPTNPGTFLVSLSAYDLTSSQIVAHLPAVTANGSSGTLQCGMGVGVNNDNQVYLQKDVSSLHCEKKVAGVKTLLSLTPYNAVNHLFWRIRADASNIYWETSATGSGAFFIQHTINIATLGFPITAVGAWFWASYTSFEPFPGTLQIESVNPGLPMSMSGASTSSGSLALTKTGPVQITFSGSSTSAGSLSMMTVSPLEITGSAASTSSGSLTFTNVPAGILSLTGSGASTSSGSLALTKLAILQITGAASSTSTGTLALTKLGAILEESYYYFEPPIVYDLPPTLPEPTRPRYLNAHAKWKGGQRRGRSILKIRTPSLYPLQILFPEEDLFPANTLSYQYVTVDTPTVDQMAAAEFTYQGGHVYIIDTTEAVNLTAAGYTIGAALTPTEIDESEAVLPSPSILPSMELVP